MPPFVRPTVFPLPRKQANNPETPDSNSKIFLKSWKKQDFRTCLQLVEQTIRNEFSLAIGEYMGRLKNLREYLLRQIDGLKDNENLDVTTKERLSKVLSKGKEQREPNETSEGFPAHILQAIARNTRLSRDETRAANFDPILKKFLSNLAQPGI